MGLEVPPRGWREKATAEAGGRRPGQGTRGPLTRQPGRDRGAGGQSRLRGAPEGLQGDGAGRGGGGAAWGRGAGPHNTVLPARPTRDAEARAPRPPRCTHRGKGSVRALSGCGVGGLRFSRSLDPDSRVPARVPSSGPSTNQQRLHFRSPCHSDKWLPEVPPLAAGIAAGGCASLSLEVHAVCLAHRSSTVPAKLPTLFSFFLRLELSLSLHLSCNCLPVLIG